MPIDFLIPNKSYAFFSHTIKAQEANMALLDALMEKVKIHFSFVTRIYAIIKHVCNF